MPKLHEKYETMVVYSLKNGEDQIVGLNQKFTTMIESGATLVRVDEWGKKRLAYPINYEADGFYVLYCFDCEPDFPQELERVLRITEGVLRFLTVVRQEAPPKPEGAEEASKAEKAEEIAEAAQEEATEKVEE